MYTAGLDEEAAGQKLRMEDREDMLATWAH